MLVLSVLVLLAGTALIEAAAAVIVIHNQDPPGVGFNDPTFVPPAGGNPGNTLGQQRLNVLRHAAAIWGAVLDSPSPIVVDAYFYPQGFGRDLSCDATSAELAGATALDLFKNFPRAPLADTWYPAALADALRGRDNGPGSADVLALFNPRLDDDPACFQGRGWYYGLDHNPGQAVDLLVVVLHELAHGLGFQSFTDIESGLLFQGAPSVYDAFVFDSDQLLDWTQMDAFQRQTSATNTGQLVWKGGLVTARTGGFVSGTDASGRALLYAPEPVELGSSVSHWDRSFAPNALMEPALQPGMTPARNLDLTACLLKEIGWNLSAAMAQCSADVPPFGQILLSSENVALGSVQVGESVPLGIMVGNAGARELSLGTVASADGLATPFSIGIDTCSGTTLGAGASCVIEVVFTPLAAGSYTDSFDIPTGDPSIPATIVRISGTSGDAPTQGGGVGDGTEDVSGVNGATTGGGGGIPGPLFLAGLGMVGLWRFRRPGPRGEGQSIPVSSGSAVFFGRVRGSRHAGRIAGEAIPVPVCGSMPRFPGIPVRWCAIMSNKFLSCLILLLIIASCDAGAGVIDELEVERSGDRFRVRLHAHIDAPCDAVYGALTDYANLTALSSAVRESSVIAAVPPDRHRVRTVTRLCALFYCASLTQVQDMWRPASGELTAMVLPDSGDFAYGFAHWRMRPRGQATGLQFSAELEPRFWVPPVIGTWILERMMRGEAAETMRGLERIHRAVGHKPPEPVPGRTC